MKLIIGVGLLLEGESYNKIREIEQIFSTTISNDHGLFQPPHITIKRPFQVKSLEDIQDISKTIEKFCKKQKKIKLKLSGIKSFTEKAVYFQVLNDSKVRSIHEDLLLILRSKHSIKAEAFDGPKFVAHSTIAMELDEKQHNEIERKLIHKYNKLRIDTTISKIGLFLNIDDAHWIIIREYFMENT